MCETCRVVRATQPCSNSERATTEIYSVVQLQYFNIRRCHYKFIKATNLASFVLDKTFRFARYQF